MVANRRARLRLQVNNLNSIGKRRHIQQLAIRRQRNTIRKFKSPRNLPQPGSALLPMPNRPRPRVSQIDVAFGPAGDVYLTDTRAGSVWHWEKGAAGLRQIAGRFELANGIALSANGKLLYVSAFPG